MRILKVIGSILLIMVIIGGIFVSVITAYVSNSIDFSLDDELFEAAKSSTIATFCAYDSDGDIKEIYRLNGKTAKSWVDLNDISPNLVDAFISAEDREFYKHNGVNFRRTLLAALNYILGRDKKFGASTITQQVIKNISGDNEFTVERKFSEILRALHLEMSYSKDKILELYLNIIPMTGRIVGIGEAARIYFNKSPSELTVVEAATVAAITNAPSRYNPYTDPEATKEKRDHVLYSMYKNGEITYDEYLSFISEKLAVDNNAINKEYMPWFVETAYRDVISDLSGKYGLSEAASKILLTNGTTITLTMNIEIESILEEYFSNYNNLPAEVNDGLAIAMCVYDNSTGDLLGIVGKAGDKNGNMLFNYATALHPPASTIKPLTVYAPAIDEDIINWSSLIDDNPITVKESEDGIIMYPKNSPDVYEGAITISDAIRRSKNTVAVKSYRLLGNGKVWDRVNKDYHFTGISNDSMIDGKHYSDNNEAALSMGQMTYGIPLTELTNAYTVFPNDGILNSPRSYYGVFDEKGRVILENNTESKRIYREETARIMNQLLAGVVECGTARSISLKNMIDTAGKTGTSSMNKDRLFVGYTPYVSAGIWVGYQNGSSVNSLTKSHLELWDEVMKRIHNEVSFVERDKDFKTFSVNGLEALKICKRSGLLATPDCDERDTEIGYFKRHNAPIEFCESC